MKRRMGRVGEQAEPMNTWIRRNTLSIYLAHASPLQPFKRFMGSVRLICFCTGMRNGVWCPVISPLYKPPSVMQRGLALV